VKGRRLRRRLGYCLAVVVAMGVVLLEYELLTGTRLGIRAAVWTTAVHQEPGLSLLHRIENTREGTSLAWEAYRAETVIMTLKARDGSPGCTWDRAREAAGRHLAAAKALRKEEQAGRAAHEIALTYHFQKQYDTAAAVVDRELSGCWDQPWADTYEAWRIMWLTLSDQHQEAIKQFAHYAKRHFVGKQSERVVGWVWHAYCRTDRAKEGWSTLSALYAKHPGTPLASAIQHLGGGGKSKPLPTTPPPDATPEVP
jgi:hypothetical protein